jgi:hypothetical protein
MYYGARFYDSSLGRFTSADTIVPVGVQGLDRYAYVNNSPLKYTDPSGHCAMGDSDIGCGPNGINNNSGSGGCDLGCWLNHNDDIGNTFNNGNTFNSDGSVGSNTRRPGEPRCMAEYCENLEWLISSFTMVLDGLSFGISLLEAIDSVPVYSIAIDGCGVSGGTGCGPALLAALAVDIGISQSYGFLENGLSFVSTGLTAYNDGWLLGNTGYDRVNGFYIGKDTVVSARNTVAGLINPESFIDLGINSSQILYDIQRGFGTKPGGYLQGNEIWSEVKSKDWLWW